MRGSIPQSSESSGEDLPNSPLPNSPRQSGCPCGPWGSGIPSWTALLRILFWLELFSPKKASNPLLVIICAMSGNLADSPRRTTILFSGYDVCCLDDSFFAIVTKSSIIEGSLEVKLPTIWTDEKQRREEAERRERLEGRRVEEKESEESRCRCEKR